MIIWFVLQGVLTISIFMVYIANSGYGGGEVGMAPLAVMLAVIIQFVLSIVLFYVFRKYLTNRKCTFFFLFGMFLYELAYVFFAGGMPIFGIFEKGLIGDLNRGYSLSSIISGMIIMTAFYIFNLLYPEEVKS